MANKKTALIWKREDGQSQEGRQREDKQLCCLTSAWGNSRDA